MPSPASNDPIDPDAIGGGSDKGVLRASTVIRWAIVGTLAVALALFYALTAGAEELTGKVIRVSDGDTITVLGPGNKQHKIRLMGIDAPEKAQPFGNKSRESLASMVAGRNVVVEWHKRDRYGRLVGQVFADSHDVGLVQIERGLAWHYKAYEREQRPEDAQAYAHAEGQANAARIGLWAYPRPVPPWEWRRARKWGAIQAKAFAPDHSLRKEEIDSFLSESSRRKFSFRLIIATTDGVGSNALEAIKGQEKPVGLVLRGDLLRAEVAWPTSVGGKAKPLPRKRP